MKKSMNFLEFTQKFSSEEICIQTLEHVRWGDKVVSPFDPTSKVYKCKIISINVRTQTDILL